MSDRSLTVRPKIGGFAYFLVAGAVVDAVTVSVSARPDNNPATNWPGMGVLAMMQPEVKEQEDLYLKPLRSGGYEEVDESHVVAQMWNLDLEGMTDIAFEMMFGIDPITLGTAQIPATVLQRKVTGWLAYEAVQQDSDLLCYMNVWGEFKLREQPVFGPEPTKAKLRFRQKYSAIAGITFPDNS